MKKGYNFLKILSGSLLLALMGGMLLTSLTWATGKGLPPVPTVPVEPPPRTDIPERPPEQSRPVETVPFDGIPKGDSGFALPDGIPKGDRQEEVQDGQKFPIPSIGGFGFPSIKLPAPTMNGQKAPAPKEGQKEEESKPEGEVTEEPEPVKEPKSEEEVSIGRSGIPIKIGPFTGWMGVEYNAQTDGWRVCFRTEAEQPKEAEGLAEVTFAELSFEHDPVLGNNFLSTKGGIVSIDPNTNLAGDNRSGLNTGLKIDTVGWDGALGIKNATFEATALAYLLRVTPTVGINHYGYRGNGGFEGVVGLGGSVKVGVTGWGITLVPGVGTGFTVDVEKVEEMKLPEEGPDYSLEYNVAPSLPRPPSQQYRPSPKE